MLLMKIGLSIYNYSQKTCVDVRAYSDKRPQSWYFFSFFIWFWGMAFSEALTITWLNDFFGTFLLKYFQVIVKYLCAGQGFSQNMISKLAFRTYFQIWLLLEVTLHVHKISTKNFFWKNIFWWFSFMEVSNIYKNKPILIWPLL